MTNQLLETILKYHDAGFSITPLRDKIPFKKNWQHAGKLNQSEFENVKSAGWVIPKTHLVIDVDNHDAEKTGNKSLKQLSESFNFDLAKNAAVKVNTASGGLHLYFRVPEQFQDCTFPNSLPNFPCVEFKHVGRQVVIPNSTLTDGRGYKFHILTGGDLTKINALPDKIVEVLKGAPTPKKPDAKAVAADKNALDCPADIERFAAQLSELPMQTEGDRNNLFYRLACDGKDFGLSRKKVFDNLVIFNREKVHPQLDQGEIQHCVNSAFKYSKSLTPYRSVAADFAAEDINVLTKKLTEEEAKKQFTECIDWRESFIRDSKGTISRTKFATKNTEIFLDNLPEFHKKLAVNLFSMDTIWRRPAPWHKPTILTGEIDRVLDDDDLIRIREALNKEGYDPAGNHILEAARSVSLRNEYHPVKEYFEGLPVWDGAERLKHFFPVFCGAEDCAYSQ